MKFIEASGTHFEIGCAIGEELKSEIEHSTNLFLENLCSSNEEKSEYIERSQKFMKICAENFPDFIKELNGISYSSCVPYDDLFLFSLEEEIGLVKSCSSIGIKNIGETYIGHNEDWNIDLDFYVIKAKPKNKPKFISLAQAGNYPGLLGINEHGFAFVSNSVECGFYPYGMPKLYMLRKMLENTDIKNLINYLENKKRTIGCNLLVASGSEIYKVEWSQDKFNFSNEGMLAQTNHFTLPGMNCGYEEQSYNRLESLENSYKENKSLKEILYSHDYFPNSVCRHSESKTLASAIIDVSGRKISISNGNPCTSKYIDYNL